MKVHGSMSLWALLISLLSAAPLSVQAQQHPVKLATDAYLSVRADSAVKELTSGRSENASTIIQRLAWLPEAEQSSAYTVGAPVTHIAWKETAFSFVPQNQGNVRLELYGTWEKAPGADIYRQEVAWDDIRVTGAALQNGSFELPLDAPGSPWKSAGGIRLAASEELPAADGQYLIKTWHNERVIADLAVVAGQRVTIRVKMRAVKPAGFTEMKRIADRDTPAHKAAKLLKRGVNFGNYLEVPPDQTWSLKYNDEDFDQVKAEGFDHVRLPVGWHHHTGHGPKYPLTDEILAKVDKQIESARKRNLAIIINIHHFDDFTTDPVKYRDKFAAIWSQLALHYANADAGVFFELLNEPKDAATTEVMNPIYAEVIHIIRQSNPRRTILVGPGRWNTISELANLKLPDDDQNLIVTVHNYEPFQFTHQGATWAGPDVAVKGIRFPGPPPHPLTIDRSISIRPHARDWLTRYNSDPGDSNPSSEALHVELGARAKSWSDYYGRPVHCGEFGVIVDADPDSRANYVRSFRKAFEAADIGWALWDWKAGFRYWDADHHLPAPRFREALFPKTNP